MAAKNLNDWIEGEGQTVGAVTVDLVTYPVDANTTAYLFARTVLHVVATGIGGGISTLASVSRAVGGTTVDAQNTIVNPGQLNVGLAGASVAVVAVGNTLVVRATGVVGLTIKWMCRAEPKSYTP